VFVRPKKPEAVRSAAKRYCAEIVMPFRSHIEKRIGRVAALDQLSFWKETEMEELAELIAAKRATL